MIGFTALFALVLVLVRECRRDRKERARRSRLIGLGDVREGR